MKQVEKKPDYFSFLSEGGHQLICYERDRNGLIPGFQTAAESSGDVSFCEQVTGQVKEMPGFVWFQSAEPYVCVVKDRGSPKDIFVS